MGHQEVANDLLELAAQLKPWQRDAMRRLASADALTEEDESELLAMIKKSAGIPTDTKQPSPTPIRKEHFAVPGDIGLRLVGIRNIRNVNRLDDQAQIEFAPDGLTAVFGKNASGKTGYIRILRSACRTERSDPGKLRVLADIYGDKADVPREADIHYNAGGREVAVSWRDGEPALSELGAVRVFDTDLADVYVDKEHRLRHLPFRLNIPHRLNELCLKLRDGRLKPERAEIQRKLSAVIISPLPADETQARVFLSDIRATTRDDEIRQASQFTANNSSRLVLLRQMLGGKAAEIADVRSLSEWCRSRSKYITETTAELSNERIETLVALHREAVVAREAADAAAESMFDDEPLKGIGSEHWRILWKAAQEYSQAWAYPDEEFPVLHDHEGNPAACVLCQQPLDGLAQKRMQSFKDFISGAAARHAATAEAAAATARSRFDSLEISLSAADPMRLDQLEVRNQQLAQAVREWYGSAQTLYECVDKIIRTGQEIALPKLGNQVARNLLVQVETLEREAREREQALSPDERGKLESERRNLEGRETLSKAGDALQRKRDLMRVLSGYNLAISGIDTGPITKRIKPLIDKHLTSQMVARFQIELENLKMDHLRIGLRDVSNRESAIYETDLGSTRIRRSSEILSEGEQRAVALGAFLTEAAVSTPGAPIVFDDPVSSLDHERMVSIAYRLAEEAQNRQVIVFTHSLEFLYGLEKTVEEAGNTFLVRTIFRTSDGRTGQLDPSPLPWKGQRIDRRMNVLRDRLAKIKKSRNEIPEEYELGVRQVYTLLRDTYERFVEEILFHNVVRRYSPDVRVKELRYVSVPDNIVRRFHRGYDNSCDYAHDNPRGSPVGPPEPAEIERDLDAFEALVNDAKTSHAKTAQNRQYMKA